MAIVTNPQDRVFDVPGWERPRDNGDAEFLQGLRREDINTELFQTEDGSVKEDGFLRLRAVLRSHPGPIERHEGSFIMGELQPSLAVTELISSVLRDRSVVVRHESTEALGRMKDPVDAEIAHRALVHIFIDEAYQEKEDAEVLSTMQLAIGELERRFPDLVSYRKNFAKKIAG